MSFCPLCSNLGLLQCYECSKYFCELHIDSQTELCEDCSSLWIGARRMNNEAPVWTKVIVTTGQPKCLVLVEDTDNSIKLPIFPLQSDKTCEEIAEEYCKNNFGFCEPWCDVSLVDVYDSLYDEELRKLYIVYSITIAEENKIERGRWIDLNEAMFKLKKHDIELVRKSINKWIY